MWTRWWISSTRPTREVLIETKLVELSSNPSTSKGVDWSGTLQAQNVSFGNGVLQSASQSHHHAPGHSRDDTGRDFAEWSHHHSGHHRHPGSSTLTTLISAAAKFTYARRPFAQHRQRTDSGHRVS